MIKGSDDARGQVRRAATVDELQQRMEVHRPIPGQGGRGSRINADAEQLLRPPRNHVGSLGALAHIPLGVDASVALTLSYAVG